MEPSGERSVKPKVTMEYHNPENLDEFIQELKEIYLKIEMSKKDAEEELVETKKNLIRFMEKYRSHPSICRYPGIADAADRPFPCGPSQDA